MKITRDNYEAFLLDRLEGSLSLELLNELELFLLANPDLKVNDEALPHIVDEQVYKMPKRDSLKSTLPPNDFDITQLVDLLVGKLEGDLSPEPLRKLDELIGTDSNVALAWREMKATKTIPAPLTFSDKDSLRKGGRVIAFRPFLAIAASIALLIGILWWAQPSGHTGTGTLADVESPVGSVPSGSKETTTEVTSDTKAIDPVSGQGSVLEQFNDQSSILADGSELKNDRPQQVIERYQMARLASVRSIEHPDLVRSPNSVATPDVELVAYSEPARSETLDDGSVTVTELLVGTFRKEVLDDEPTTEALNRGDALAMFNKGIKQVAGQESGIDLDDGSTTDGRRRYGLRLGDISISASMSN